MPLLYSGSGDVTAEVVFVGYGITAPDLGRDEYAGVDVAGKVVMALRGAPNDRRDWLAYDSHRAPHGQRPGARRRRLPVRRVGDRQSQRRADRGPADGGRQRRNCQHAAVRAWRHCCRPPQGARRRRRGELRYRPLGAPAVAAPPPREVEAGSVVGWLPGGDPALRGEYVIVGAHLDHVGNWPVLMPGADDNASGSATVLEIARAACAPPAAAAPVAAVRAVRRRGDRAARLEGARREAAARCSGGALASTTSTWSAPAPAPTSRAARTSPALFQALERARDRVQPGMPLKAGRSDGEPRADHGPFQAAGIPAVSRLRLGRQPPRVSLRRGHDLVDHAEGDGGDRPRRARGCRRRRQRHTVGGRSRPGRPRGARGRCRVAGATRRRAGGVAVGAGERVRADAVGDEARGAARRRTAAANPSCASSSAMDCDDERQRVARRPAAGSSRSPAGASNAAPRSPVAIAVVNAAGR